MSARFRELIQACHQRGLRLLVYVGYGVARNAPEMQGHHDEWSVLPLIPWDPSYKPFYDAVSTPRARTAVGPIGSSRAPRNSFPNSILMGFTSTGQAKLGGARIRRTAAAGRMQGEQFIRCIRFSPRGN